MYFVFARFRLSIRFSKRKKHCWSTGDFRKVIQIFTSFQVDTNLIIRIIRQISTFFRQNHPIFFDKIRLFEIRFVERGLF
jgi:hypothetical protein